jgi:hypothetical protein
MVGGADIAAEPSGLLGGVVTSRTEVRRLERRGALRQRAAIVAGVPIARHTPPMQTLEVVLGADAAAEATTVEDARRVRVGAARC